MKKNVIKNKNTATKDSSALKNLALLAAVVCIAGLVWAFIKYQNSSSLITKSQSVIDEQINIVNGFPLSYLQTIQGDANQASKISQGISAFNASLNKEKTGIEMIKPDAKQSNILDKISGNWQTMEAYLTDVVNGKDAVKSVRTGATSLSTLASEIELSSRKIKASLDTFQNVGGIISNLDALNSSAKSLDSSIQKILLSGDDAKDIANGLGKNIEIFFSAASNVDKEISAQGPIVFNTPKDAEQVKTLNTKVESFQIALAELTSYVPQFLQVSNSAIDIDRQTTNLTNSLRELKDTYTNAIVKPAPNFPFTYIQLLIGLLLLSIALLAAWALMQIASGNKLQKEAIRLKMEAEERTKNDQDAILRLMDELADLSEGDLTVEAQVTEDFTGAIADSINFTVESMREMVGTITNTSEEINRATESTQNIAQLLEESSHEQSSQITTSNETATKMATSLSDIAENTDASVDIARSSVDIAKEGRDRVRSTIRSMSNIRENIQDTAKRIKRLGESSQEIGDIVEIIKSIADQTNVLALNAAIQATSAGEAGRGFAVVADEVQRLAERSANATKRIEVLVKTIQADANEAVSSMENSTRQVVDGASIAEEAGQSLDKIENVSQNLAHLIVNVSKATKNAAGMAQTVANSMGELSQLNEKTVQDVTTSTLSIGNLNELSHTLKDSVSGFRLPE